MVMKLLSVLLVLLFAFLLGVTLTADRKLDAVERVKLMVSDFIEQPRTTTFRDVNLHRGKANINDYEAGNVCGEVLLFKEEIPYKFKRFIVEVTENKQGEEVLSFPLIDSEGEMIPEPDFQKIWDERCN